MSVNYDNVQFASSANAFKNDNTLYSNTFAFPTSLTSGQLYQGTQTTTLSVTPKFSKFYANFKEYLDASFGTGSAQWYDAQTASLAIGLHISAPVGNVGWISGGLFPVLNGNQLIVTAYVANPYSNTVTIDALSVPYVFITYTLGN